MLGERHIRKIMELSKDLTRLFGIELTGNCSGG